MSNRPGVSNDRFGFIDRIGKQVSDIEAWQLYALQCFVSLALSKFLLLYSCLLRTFANWVAGIGMHFGQLGGAECSGCIGMQEGMSQGCG